MPIPTSSASERERNPPEGPAYLCPNVRCRFRVYQRLTQCPQCGRAGKFVLESFVKTWNLLAGLMFVMIGLMLMGIGLFFIVGVASGRLTNGSHGWEVNLILPAIAAIFILGGVSTIRGHSWFVWLLLLLRR